ncbi:TVP38/TMEM64 family protein [Desulfobulbus rhabdoformis]|jgi:uncharacterized membrane protein YdjX (TVP38/TMEM64 family)|uniref:TVP38/TMEM64 family protein n=1 Tax=Desulfobulbus rhabdoformis TaxID=34032 RepID=UPI0019663946|nr:TVP38/TMEM64 family protein [Desulfobulbus rhabdoformis]MBM9615490.1 TVP38/TMEM64 family protein [Desulfobulbus rhabdoformis]
MNSKKIVLLGGAALMLLLFFVFDLDRFLTLESLQTHRELLQQHAHDHPLAAPLLFMALYIVQTAFSLPGAAILSLSAGLLFGAFAGTLYAVVAATIGATLAFLVARYLLHDTVQQRFGARLETINQELAQRGFNYLLFLRLVPLFPFFLINLAAGLTRLPLRTFFLATMVGIIPGGFVYVNAGAGLAAIHSLGDVASARVLGSFVLLGLFALIPVAWQKWKGQAADSMQQ